jgi:hypothetical protein
MGARIPWARALLQQPTKASMRRRSDSQINLHFNHVRVLDREEPHQLSPSNRVHPSRRQSIFNHVFAAQIYRMGLLYFDHLSVLQLEGLNLDGGLGFGLVRGVIMYCCGE